MSKFKLGERVIFFAIGKKRVGIIQTTNADKSYIVRERLNINGGFHITAHDCHEKQLRKIKPKRKPREWAVWVDSEGEIHSTSSLGTLGAMLINVREVLK